MASKNDVSSFHTTARRRCFTGCSRHQFGQCGLGWDRIHLDTLEVEPLHRSLLPEEYDGLRWCGVSAHYGLVAFGESRPNPSGDFRVSDADAVPELFRLKIRSAEILVDPNDM